MLDTYRNLWGTHQSIDYTLGIKFYTLGLTILTKRQGDRWEIIEILIISLAFTAQRAKTNGEIT